MSTPYPLEVPDNIGKLLTYHLRIPDNFVNILVRETALLPPVQAMAIIKR
jgi:hypothetical protein